MIERSRVPAPTGARGENFLLRGLLLLDLSQVSVSPPCYCSNYCNSLLSGSPKHLLDKLRKVQNSAARLVFKARKHEHIKPLIQKLHWLPVVSRIQYKVATVCYNYFTESYPVYLSEHLTVYHPYRQLRSSSDTRTFRIPFTKTKTFRQRAFSFTDPTQWNSLPYDVRRSVSTSFKQALKTHLFKSAYN